VLAIDTKVWAHNTNSHASKKSVAELRRSAPKVVGSFADLIEEVSKVSYHNSRFFIFFRGQSSEHYTRGKLTHNTSIMPTIYRDYGKRLSVHDIENRFANLQYAEQLIPKLLSTRKNYTTNKLTKYPELAWSILQHYEICPTPLLDITQSLLVAASFALNKHRNGFVYVFGLPIITNGISYSIEDELLNIKLSSCCPPQAKRPFHQEAYLLSTFPAKLMRRHMHLDCAKRLIAKYKLQDGGSFFGAGFAKLQRNALYPNSKDSLYTKLKAEIINFPFPEQMTDFADSIIPITRNS
jgi:hypothetical protein